MYRERAVLGFWVALLANACGMDQHYEKSLHGTWACDGYGIDVGGETYYPDGRYARFVFGSSTAESAVYRLPDLHEGRYEFSRRGLTIRSMRLADQTDTPKSSEANAGTVVRFQAQKLTPNFIELLQETLDAKQNRPVKTCRRIEEKNLGQHHALYKQQRFARLNSNPSLSSRPLDSSPSTAKVETTELPQQSSKTETQEFPSSSDKPLSPGMPVLDQNLVSAKQRALEDFAALDLLLRNKMATYGTLKALSASLLPKLHLMRIEMKQGAYEIHGVSDSKDRITRYISNLNRSPFVDQLSLQRLLERNSKHYFNFKFRQHESSADFSYGELKLVEQLTQNVGETKQQLKNLKTLRQTLLTRLPPQNYQTQTLQSLRQMAEAAGLHFTRYEKTKLKKVRGVGITTVEMTAYGNYDAFMLYMGRVALLEFPVAVELMTLDPFRYRRDSGQVDVTLRLSIYMALKPLRATSVSASRGSSGLEPLSTYPILKLHDPAYTWNPFNSVADRTHELCEEIVGKNEIEKLELVRTGTTGSPIAWIKSPQGQIWRVKLGTCVAKNIHVRKIAEGKIELQDKSRANNEKHTVITQKTEVKIR